MAQYKTDLRDIYFNLFEVLKVQDLKDEYDETEFRTIIDEFDKFTGKEVYPTRLLSDEQGVHLTEAGVKAPECFKAPIKSYYENGWFGLGQPEEFGGMPSSYAVETAANSLYTGANVSFCMYTGLSKGALNVIREIGSQEQKERYIPGMMSGAWGGTMCLTEPGAGSDVGAVKTTATPLADGKYKISGVKIFISSGESDLYENNIHLVLARTPGAPEGTKGLSLFIVPRYKINADGSSAESNNVKCTKVEEKMGIHGSATCEMTFGQDGDCIGEIIGEELEGMRNMFIMMNEARLLCGLQGESQANMAVQLTLQYAQERNQFGKAIVDHPDVRRMLLKMRALGRGMRALLLYTANLFELKEKDATIEEEIALLTPICKSYCTDFGFQICVDAVQVHGGYGYCTEYGIEQFVRDIKIASIYEGTNGIQAIDFVMRKILKDQGKAFTALASKIQNTMSRPEAANWEEEVAMMGKLMQKGQAILQQFGKFASENKFDMILQSATSFQDYAGNLIVAWQLLEGACTAAEKIESASGYDKTFYQSKIDDFQVFVTHYLSQNLGLANNILAPTTSVMEMNV